MPYAGSNTIALNISAQSPYVELIANATISPGMLVIEEANETCTVHGLEKTFAEALFAYENVYSGGDIDTDYAIDERVMLRVCRPGDMIVGIVNSPGPIAIGDYLTSYGDGTLQKQTAATDYVVAISLEADAVPSVDKFTKIRII